MPARAFTRKHTLKTEIIAIIDASGSMASLATETIASFNKFLDEQKTVPGEGRMTVARFDTSVYPIYSGVPLSAAPHLNKQTYLIGGYTALYDAIGATLNGEGARIAKEAWADKVICVIVTDGLENASKEYTNEQIKKNIAHAEQHGWSFIYMGANQDAFSVSANLGSTGQSVHYAASAAGTQSAYATASISTRSLRSGSSMADLQNKVELVDPAIKQAQPKTP